MPTKAYEQGFHSVFQLIKIATSRWREAVRSGELGLEGGEALKARMGVDPLREADGMYTGWRERARKAGYDAFEPKIRDIPDTLRSVAQNGINAQLKRRLQAGVAFQGNGVLPLLESTAVTPDVIGALKLRKGHRMDYLTDPSYRRQLGGALASHEGSEITHLRRGESLYQSFKDNELTRTRAQLSGGVSKPLVNAMERFNIVPTGTADLDLREPILRNPQSGLASGAHASPRVLLEEIRNTRMLAPKVQETMKSLRAMNGGQELKNLKAVAGESLNIPRNAIPHMDKTMRGADGAIFNELRGEFAKGEAQGGKGLLRNTLKILPGAGLARRLLGR